MAQKHLSPVARLPTSPRNARSEPISKTALKQWLLILLGFFLGHFHGRLHSLYSELFRSEPSKKGDDYYSADVSTATSSSLIQEEEEEGDDGWTTIEVFRGINASYHPSNNHNRWHSQARQDELVVAILRNKTDGYFVDLAANDAMHLSNTYSLERDWRWQGVCIEPNPIYWHNLTAYRSCAKIAAVVGNKSMEEVYFRFEAGDHGGIAGDGFDNGRRWQSNSERRYTVTLEEILERRVYAPAVMDYLSLDVEGSETFIMNHFPFHRYRFRVITAERLRGEIRTTLKAHGYEFVQQLSRFGESLWIHNEHRDEMDLSAVESFNFPV